MLMARKEEDAEGQKQFAALRQGLSERGWSDGQAFHIETRWTVADAAEALKFAQELISLKPEVLIANGTPSLVAARQVTSAIPIVFISVADPVGQGFVPSLARPGGNVTGFSAEEASTGSKWLELLKELAPRVTRLPSFTILRLHLTDQCFFLRCKLRHLGWRSLFQFRRYIKPKMSTG